MDTTKQRIAEATELGKIEQVIKLCNREVIFFSEDLRSSVVAGKTEEAYQKLKEAGQAPDDIIERFAAFDKDFGALIDGRLRKECYDTIAAVADASALQTIGVCGAVSERISDGSKTALFAAVGRSDYESSAVATTADAVSSLTVNEPDSVRMLQKQVIVEHTPANVDAFRESIRRAMSGEAAGRPAKKNNRMDGYNKSGSARDAGKNQDKKDDRDPKAPSTAKLTAGLGIFHDLHVGWECGVDYFEYLDELERRALKEGRVADAEICLGDKLEFAKRSSWEAKAEHGLQLSSDLRFMDRFQRARYWDVVAECAKPLDTENRGRYAALIIDNALSKAESAEEGKLVVRDLMLNVGEACGAEVDNRQIVDKVVELVETKPNFWSVYESAVETKVEIETRTEFVDVSMGESAGIAGDLMERAAQVKSTALVLSR